MGGGGGGKARGGGQGKACGGGEGGEGVLQKRESGYFLWQCTCDNEGGQQTGQSASGRQQMRRQPSNQVTLCLYCNNNTINLL